MSIESLGQLESRLQNLIDKLELSRMEVEDLRTTNSQLENEIQELKQEKNEWGERIRALLGKLDVVGTEEEEELAEDHREAEAVV